jgi:AhpD family alkylhydroperoxidase
MARVSFPAPETLSPEYQKSLRKRPPLNLYRMLPRAGVLAPHFLRMGGAIRDSLALSPRLREIAIVRVGALTGAAYEVHHHRALAKRAGVSDTTLNAVCAVDEAQPGAGLGGDDALVVRYTDALVRDVRADDALFAAMEHAVGTDQVAELTMVVGFYLLVSRFLTNFDIEIETELKHDDWL